MLPDVVLYDPDLVVTMPAHLTVVSALNAIAHAVEALYAPDRDAASDALAWEGLRAFAEAMPKVLTDGSDLTAREATQRGTWACGTVLRHVAMSLHHKLCHTLGGSFGLPHAETHAVILPHAMAYNAQAVPAEIAPLFGGTEPAHAMWDFAAKMGAPMALRDLGLAERDLDRAADLATQNAYENPRPVTRDGIRVLLDRAWRGDRPQM